MNDQTVVSASREQVSCDLEGDTVILNLKNSTYYELNPVAARIWELIRDPASIAHVRTTIAREYEVDPIRLERELQDLLGDLNRHNLLVIHDGSIGASDDQAASTTPA